MPPAAKALPQPLRDGPGAASPGCRKLRFPPALRPATQRPAELSRIRSVGRPCMTLPYACPGPRKASTPGPGGLRHPLRAQKSSLRLQDGSDSRMMLDSSEKDTHRHGKMAERGREGRAHGVMGSGQAIARFSKYRQVKKKKRLPRGRRRVKGRSLFRGEQWRVDGIDLPR